MNIYKLPQSWDVKKIRRTVRRKFPDFIIDKIEIQPATRCQLSCPWCCGKNFVPPIENREVFLGIYVENVLKPIFQYKPRIIIGGSYSEPMMYSDFNGLMTLINKMGFRFGLYTNGLKLNKESAESILTNSHPDSYISINFSAIKFRGIEDHKAIREFTKLRDKLNPSFKVNIPMFLVWELEELKITQQQLIEDGVDFIRYRKPDFPFFPTQQLKGEKIVFDTKPFHHCYSMTNSLAIACDGNVYPCPHTANSNFSHLCLGSILREDIMSIWNRRDKLWHKFDPSKEICECNHYENEWNRFCSFLANNKKL